VFANNQALRKIDAHLQGANRVVKLTRITPRFAKSFFAIPVSDSPTPGNATVKGATVAGMENLRIRFRARVGDHINRGRIALVRQVLQSIKTENPLVRRNPARKPSST
jgi:hypothetical protein